MSGGFDRGFTTSPLAGGGGGGGGGITELTGDVEAGPGAGSQAATVVGLQGNAVSSISPNDGQVLTWNGSAWVPGAPAAGGSGGGGQVYFLNFGTPAQAPTTNLPGTPKELGLVAEVASTSVTSPNLPSNGTYLLVAGFVTKLSAPGLDTIPAGIWDFNIWATTNVVQENTTIFRLKVYKYDGVNSPSLLATGNPVPLYDPTQTIQYVSSVAIPQTTILTTDRIYVEIEARATSASHTLTVSFGDGAPSHVHTTLPSIAGTGIVHVINGVVQSPASPVDFEAGSTEITGTLPIINGGTGLDTNPANGELLIGNGTDYTLATLTQGSNITITNGAGTITIDAVDFITGTINTNEVAFGDSTNSISGSGTLTFNPVTSDLTVGDGVPHSIRIGPYGYVSNPIIESLESMNINIVNFSGALGIQAANNDLVLIGGDDGGGQSYLQTQNNVRLESKGRLLVQPATDIVNAALVADSAGNPILTVNSLTPQVVVDTTIGTQALVVQDTGVSVSSVVEAGVIRQTSNLDIATITVVGSLGLRFDADSLGGLIPTITSRDENPNPYPLNLDIGELQINGSPGAAGEILTSNGPGAAPTWQPNAANISGTIAVNELAFGTSTNVISGTSYFAADPAAKTVTLTGDVNPVLVLVDEISASPFVQATPTSRELAVLADPLVSADSTTISPTDVAVGDGTQSGNVSAGRVGVADVGTGNKLSMQLPGAVATITSEDGASNPFPLNLVIEELQINAAPGNLGDVLTSQGTGAAPIWSAPAAAAADIAKQAVRVATTVPLPSNTYTAGTLTATSNGDLNTTGIDGVTTLAVNDRVLVKNEVSNLKNLIYEITDLGIDPVGPPTPAVPAPATFSGALITCGPGGTHATLTAAVAAASPGDRIQILAGTITEVATVTVNKSLEIFGAGTSSIIQRASTSAVITVTVGDVYLHDFHIINNQLASGASQAACINADTMNRTSYGGATGLYFENLECEHSAAGIFISGTGWVIKGCTFRPSAVNISPTTTLRSVFSYGSEGQSFIYGNSLTTGTGESACTMIYLSTRNDGVAPNWEGGYMGDLVIDGNSIIDGGGAPRSYIDATSIYHQSGPAATAPPTGGLSMFIVNNNFSLDHRSSPCVFFGRSYSGTPVQPLSFFYDFVVDNNSFGAREVSLNQKGAIFWTNTAGVAVAMGAFIGGFYGASNTIDAMVLPATNTTIMLDSTLLMVRENAYYNAPSPLLTLTPTVVGSPWSMTYSADFDTNAEVTRGVFTSVNEGTTNTETTWIVVTPDPITVGSTGISWQLIGDKYSPSTPADWSGSPVAISLAVAIDRLAAAVAGLLGTPVP